MKILENNITNELSSRVNNFLMDISQMYDEEVYSLVLDHEYYTSEDIKKLEKFAKQYGRLFANGLSDDEIEYIMENSIVPEVRNILRNNLK